MISLVAVGGPLKGKTFFLKRFPFQIGRGSKNDLVLNDAHVSANHAIIVKEDDALFVVDLGSANGTVVNREPTGRCELKNGDTLEIGRNLFRVNTGGFATVNGAHPSTVRIDPGPESAADGFATLKGFDHTVYMRPEDDVEMLRRSHKALRVLYSADSILENLRDVKATLSRIIDLVASVFEAERAFAMLTDPDSGELISQAQHPAGERINVSGTISARVLENQESVLSQDALTDQRFAQAQSIMAHNVRSVMCVPLKSGDRVLGMLYVDRSSDAGRFDEDDLKLFTALGCKAGVGAENALLYHDVQRLFLNTIETMVDTIRAKDEYTRGHSERVRGYAMMLGEAIGLEAQDMDKLALAAVLHDVGKIGMPDRLLYNKDALSPEEYEEIKVHAAQGADLLCKIDRLKEIVPIVRHHHEAIDGTGYPDGLKGDEIPLLSKIIAIADTFDACTTDRPYQKGKSREEAIEILRGAAGSRLEPDLVEAFISALNAWQKEIEEAKSLL